LDQYKLLITSFAPHLTDDFLARALRWVEAGGTWIVGPMTHWRTAEHTVPINAAVGDLEAAAGVQVAGVYSLWDVPTAGRAFDQEAPLGAWSTFMTTAGADSIGRVTQGRSAGLEFLTEQPRGHGRIVMLGAWPEGLAGAEMLRRLVRHYASSATVKLRHEASADVVVAPRTSAKGPLWIAANLGSAPGHVVLPRAGTDVVSQRAVAAGSHPLPPYGWIAVQFA
jgi:beta-galactosidase